MTWAEPFERQNIATKHFELESQLDKNLGFL